MKCSVFSYSVVRLLLGLVGFSPLSIGVLMAQVSEPRYRVDKVVLDPVYRCDSALYSNGSVVRFEYDSLGNRSISRYRPSDNLSELRVVSDSIPDTLGLGSNGHLPVAWRNSGPVAASGFRLTPFLSVDSIVDPGDTPLPPTFYAGLFAPVRTEWVPTLIDLPLTGLTPGQDIHLILYIDDDDQVVEYSDSNNTWVKRVHVVDCPAAPSISATVTPEVCGLDNGRVSVSVPGALELTWWDGVEDTVRKGLTGDDHYPYILFDPANGCSYSDSVFIAAFPDLQGDVLTRPITCDSLNGQAEAVATSGTPPYTYSWVHGPATPAVTDLAPGGYTVTIADSAGCQNTFPVNIGEVTPPEVSIERTNTTCQLANGEMTAVVVGGTPAYTYTWSNGQSGQTATGLADSASYLVTVIDSTGCSAGAAAALVNVGSNEVTIEVSGDYLIAQGQGSLPYQITWNTGQTQQSILPLDTGTYFVFITNAEGCTDSASITLVGDTTTPPMPTAIRDIRGHGDFYVYPNPNDGRGTMLHTNVPDIDHIEIHDGLGRIVWRQDEVTTPGETLIGAELRPGNYALTAFGSDGHQLASTRFLVR